MVPASTGELMADELADALQLDDVDSELGLVGCFLAFPAATAGFADGLDPHWIGNPFARYVLEAVLECYRAGSQISLEVLTDALPENCGGIPRRQFVASLAAGGFPPNMMRGAIAMVKDRWARRAVRAAGGGLAAAALRSGYSPFQAAIDGISALDVVNAAREQREAAPLATVGAELLHGPVQRRGATTGLLALDNKLNGYTDGHLYILAARPGMGKSAFMCSSLRRTAESGVGVMAFSIEMPRREFAARCLSDALNHVDAPTFGAIARGQYSMDDGRALDDANAAFERLPFMVDDSGSLTVGEIAARARKAKREFEARGVRLGVLAVDHFNLISPSGNYKGKKVEESTETSNSLRALAKELECCVLLLCQLNREVEHRENKRPALADLRWTGDLEQDAQAVIFLYRAAYYMQQDPTADPMVLHSVRHQLEAIIAKNRNGEVCNVSLWCDIAHSRIRDE